jgi:tryptophan halogenase
MKIGIYDRPWEKNVVSIGLSCGFIEPLESNGLLTVHVFLLKLIKFLGREVITRWDQDVYNSGVKRYFKSFAEFVAMHYALSVRTDTEYWREISKKSFCPSMVNSEFSDVIGFDDFARKKFNQTDYNNYDGITTIGHGMEYYNIDESVISAWSFLNKIDYKHVVDNLIPVWNEMQNYWKGVADSSPTLYEYLKTNIYE